MPELPEVETTRRGIEPHLINQYIKNIIIRESRLRWPVDSKIVHYTRKQPIEKVSRRGKYLLLHLPSGTLMIHLGMSGRLRILPEAITPNKHDHVDINLSNSKVLRFTDPRRFGSILWTKDDPYQHALLCKLGPEPLSKEFDAKYLHTRAQNRNTAIKLFIMDSQIVVGVGNIYANEALFKAGFHPQIAAKNISLAHCKILVSEIKKVLQQAIKQGGTTLRDYYSAEGNPGFFIQQLQVYGRKNQACFICKTSLTEIRLGQRSTVFCNKCQRET